MTLKIYHKNGNWDKLKGISIKNHMCYYIDGIIKIEDYAFDNVLIDVKLYNNISVHDISYKTLIGANALRIMFDKADGFIRIYDRNRYLILFGSQNYNAIYNKISQER